jgi:hypothetical protein
LARKKKTKFDLSKEVRAIARERVGRVPPTAVIPPKTSRAKVKHKKLENEEME